MNDLLLRELVRKLERKLGLLNENEMSCCGVTMAQCHAIVEIGRQKQVSLVKLAEILNLDNSTISRTVNNLVNADLVRRDPDPEDRRYVTISLTHEGEIIYTKIESDMTDCFKTILNNIPENKREQVYESLGILLDAFEYCDYTVD